MESALTSAGAVKGTGVKISQAWSIVIRWSWVNRVGGVGFVGGLGVALAGGCGRSRPTDWLEGLEGSVAFMVHVLSASYGGYKVLDA